jgi:hypothetical protein
MFDYLIGTALMRAIFGAKFDKPTFQKCLGLISFVLIALFITGAGLYQSRTLERQLARLATEAVRGRAMVLDKHETWRSNNTHYDVVVEHVTADGVRHRADPDVAQAVFEKAKIGGSIPIVYLQSEPDTFFLAGEEPTDAKLSFMRWVFRIGLGCLALSVALLLWQWPRSNDGNRGPATRAPVLRAMPAPVVSGSPRSDGPPVFGKRR